MNILMITGYWYYAIPENSFVHAQAKTYVSQGHSVRVIIPTPKFRSRIPSDSTKISSMIRMAKVDGVEILYILSGSLSNFGNKKIDGVAINSIAALISVASQWKRIMKDFIPDIIHGHALGLSNTIGEYLKKKMHKPLVITTHGGDSNCLLNNGKGDEIVAMCNKVDLLVTVSKELENRLNELNMRTQIFTNYLGCSSHKRVEFSEKKVLKVCSCSNLIPGKRVDIIIEALSLLKNTIIVEWTHIGDGPLRKNLEQMAQERLADLKNIKYVFQGIVENSRVRDLYCKNEMQLFITTSSSEGLPVSIMEATSVGIPIIGTAVNGIPEIVHENENGFLLSVNPSPKEVCQMIEKYYELPFSEKMKMSERSYREWSSNFDINKNACRMIDKYKHLVKVN